MDGAFISYLDSLSNELLALIFVHLDLQSAVRASGVSKQLHGFINDDRIWKYLYNSYYVQINPDIALSLNSNLTWRELCKKIHLYQSWTCVGEDILTDEVWQANFSPCGKFLAVSGRSKEMRVYNVKIQQTNERKSVQVSIYCTFGEDELEMEIIGQNIWSPDSTKLLVTDREERGVVLDVKEKVILAEFEMMVDTQASFLANDQILITDASGFVLIQECADGQYRKMHRKLIDTAGVTTYFNILSPDLNYIAMRFGSQISLLPAKFTEKDEIPHQDLDQPHVANKVSEISQGKYICTFSDCLNIEVGGRVTGFCFSDDDKYIALNVHELDSGKSGELKNELTMQLWDIKRVEKIASWKIGPCISNFLIFPIMGLGNSIIITGSEDGSVTLLCTQSREVLHRFKAHEKLVNHVALHPQVDLLVSVSDTNEIKFWAPNKWDFDFTFINP